MQRTSGTVGCHDYYCCYCCCLLWAPSWAPCEEMARLCSPTFNGLQLLGSLWEEVFLCWLSCLHEWLREWKASRREPGAGVVIPWNEHKAWLCPSVFYLPVFANSAHSNLLKLGLHELLGRSMSHLGGLEARQCNYCVQSNCESVEQKCWHLCLQCWKAGGANWGRTKQAMIGRQKILGCMQAFTEINYFVLF